jgi:hypothetical protein
VRPGTGDNPVVKSEASLDNVNPTLEAAVPDVAINGHDPA